MKKIVAVVQARMSSTRLPGKVLLPILGQPILLLMLERLSYAKHVDEIVIATTTEAEDDVIEEICSKHTFICYRGDKYDLLDRHYCAALQSEADIVLKIPSDCPLIDYRIIDEVIRFFISGDFDYGSNLHPASYPDGNDVEVMTMAALQHAWIYAQKDFEREHTTPYLWEAPEKFKIGNFVWPAGKDLSMSHRFTIDYMEDYLLIREVFEALYFKNQQFSLEDILGLLEKRPDIYALNKKYVGVNWYRHHLQELRTIDRSQTKIV